MNINVSKCEFCIYLTPDRKCTAPTLDSRDTHCDRAIQKMTTVLLSENKREGNKDDH